MNKLVRWDHCSYFILYLFQPWTGIHRPVAGLLRFLYISNGFENLSFLYFSRLPAAELTFLSFFFNYILSCSIYLFIVLYLSLVLSHLLYHPSVCSNLKLYLSLSLSLSLSSEWSWKKSPQLYPLGWVWVCTEWGSGNISTMLVWFLIENLRFVVDRGHGPLYQLLTMHARSRIMWWIYFSTPILSAADTVFMVSPMLSTK